MLTRFEILLTDIVEGLKELDELLQGFYQTEEKNETSKLRLALVKRMLLLEVLDIEKELESHD